MENNVHESEENMKTQDRIVFILNWFLLFKFKYHLTDDWLFVIDSYTNHVCSYCGFASMHIILHSVKLNHSVMFFTVDLVMMLHTS
jgi:hypothetical protein